MQKIKVIVLDQSENFARALKSILIKNSNIESVLTFTSLKEGINRILVDVPHVVLLDVNMKGEKDELPIKLIFQAQTLPVILIAENNVFQTAKTVQALSKGATDFIKLDQKQPQDLEAKEIEILHKVLQAAQGKQNISMKTQKKSSDFLANKIPMTTKVSMGGKVPERALIVIGSSTGGPRALQMIIQHLPSNFTTPILIVQHMPAGFTKSLAERLDKIGNVRVKEAEKGELIREGTVYVAPGNYHMTVINSKTKKLSIEINQEIERLGHRPSVNILFDSVAKIKNIHKIAVILTGMGRDGAEGVTSIKENQPNAIIIAESKETAVINGMPKAVIETKLVTDIVRVDKIAQTLVDYTKK